MADRSAIESTDANSHATRQAGANQRLRPAVPAMTNDEMIVALIAEGRLRVDADRGLVYAPRSNTPDKPVGSLTKKGYVRVCIQRDGRQKHFMLHRIIWVSVHGPLAPGHEVDHGPAGKTVNCIANLEAVAGAENLGRARRDGKLGRGGWRDAPRDPQNGQFVGKRAAGRLLDGVEHNAMPEVR